MFKNDFCLPPHPHPPFTLSFALCGCFNSQEYADTVCIFVVLYFENWFLFPFSIAVDSCCMNVSSAASSFPYMENSAIQKLSIIIIIIIIMPCTALRAHNVVVKVLYKIHNYYIRSWNCSRPVNCEGRTYRTKRISYHKYNFDSLFMTQFKQFYCSKTLGEGGGWSWMNR